MWFCSSGSCHVLVWRQRHGAACWAWDVLKATLYWVLCCELRLSRICMPWNFGPQKTRANPGPHTIIDTCLKLNKLQAAFRQPFSGHNAISAFLEQLQNMSLWLPVLWSSKAVSLSCTSRPGLEMGLLSLSPHHIHPNGVKRSKLRQSANDTADGNMRMAELVSLVVSNALPWWSHTGPWRGSSVNRP